jgi:hypothetical protein
MMEGKKKPWTTTIFDKCVAFTEQEFKQVLRRTEKLVEEMKEVSSKESTSATAKTPK